MQPMKFVLAAALFSSAALAAPFPGDSLTFNGLQAGEQVLNYYNGAFGGLGSGPGPAFGVSFTNGLAADPTTVAFGPSARVTAESVTMNLATSWTGLMSFYYSGTGTISFFAGQNASGGAVASINLANPSFPFGAVLPTFQSAVLTGGLGVDSITFGGAVIPEPSSALLTAFGVAALGWWRRGCLLRKLESQARGLHHRNSR